MRSTMATKGRSIRILMFILLASACMVSGCNKVDLEDRSKITITGNTLEGIDLNRTYGVDLAEYDGPYGTSCEASVHETTVLFTMDTGETLRIRLIKLSQSEAVSEGTFSVVGTGCEPGIIANFTASSGKKALYSLNISSGTMKVKDDDDTFDINISFTISPASGGGKLSGNFTGTMESATIR